MQTTCGRFDKWPFLKVDRYTIVCYIIFNCGSLTKFSLIFEDVFRSSSGILFFDFLTLTVDPLFSYFRISKLSFFMV